MKTISRIGLLLIVGLASVGTLFAKGPFQQVVITGEDLPAPIQIDGDEERLLSALGMVELMDIMAHAEAPADPGVGYRLTRYFEDSRSETLDYIPFDEVIFYPQASDGSAYVYYVGLVNGGSEFDGHWFDAQPDGIAAMDVILNGTSSEPSVPAFDPTTLSWWARLQAWLH